jgi:ribosome-associated toxin RatA of RatAB toxin-antitoxin module
MLQGTKTAVVPADPAAVYAVVADVERYPEWQSFVAEVDVLERDGEGRPSLVAARLDAKATVINARLRYAYDEPSGVRWSYEHGDVKDVRGSFVLAAADGGTAVTYDVAVDPGFKLGLLLRGPVEERVRARVLDGTLDELAATV